MSELTVEEIDIVIDWYDTEIDRLKSAIDKKYWTFTRCARGAWPTHKAFPEIREKYVRKMERSVFWSIRRRIKEAA